ncbi:hypothetical protein, partial [Acidiphilium sp. PM]|uniref:hypothetical protein n=1 Tax=Acidiphilium sp. PM TaxID=1043206 RepID=UPI001F51948F
MLGISGGEQRQFGAQAGQNLVAMLALPLGFLRVQAKNVTLAPLTVADHDLLGLKIVGNLPIAPRSGQNRLIHIAQPAHRHRQDVAAEP